MRRQLLVWITSGIGIVVAAASGCSSPSTPIGPASPMAEGDGATAPGSSDSGVGFGTESAISAGGQPDGSMGATGTGSGGGGSDATPRVDGGPLLVGDGGGSADASATANDAGQFPAMTCGVRELGDQGNGTYVNPILPGDFQNTDVVRVGDDYYYISATKALSPGMMVLHSKDLVNWTAIGHVIPDITQMGVRYNYDRMDGEQRGVWAGAIAYRNNLFYVYFTTPDEGIFVSTAADPAGPWAPLTRMMTAAGWDDPCPFWDDDGQSYLVTTNFALDPANGKTYNIHLFKMSADAKSLIASSDTIIHQSQGSEANKLFKVGTTYYHFFSHVTGEGRVPMTERSTSLSGPWELHQVNHVTPADRAPNQGTILQTAKGEWLFITHHGNSQWEGRPASLLPVTWAGGWPVAGRVGPDGIGNMVWSGMKPIVGFPIAAPQTDDDFSGPTLSPQWEWYFQPRAAMWSLTERPGYMRLRAFKSLQAGNVRKTGNVLTQRPRRFATNVATVKMDISNMADGQVVGFGFLGSATATLGVSQAQGARRFVFDASGAMTTGPTIQPAMPTVWLRISW
ncbi:MAG: glycoside hydrolase 43 family protein, partial [Myxococcota bacterium]|nr:glycoside hydrolase 43 family protein [Myxococcota bacterium]